MIHWKNRPISELSRSEMHDALLEMSRIAFDRKDAIIQSSPFLPFVLGAVAGSALSILSFSVAKLI